MAKDNFKDTSSDLEDSLAEVEKICCGLVSSELSYPLSQNLYALLERARIKFIKIVLYQCRVSHLIKLGKIMARI